MEMAPRISSLIIGDGFHALNANRKFNVLDKQTERANPVIQEETSNRLASAIRNLIPKKSAVPEAPIAEAVVFPTVSVETQPNLPPISAIGVPKEVSFEQSSGWKIPRKALDYIEELGDSADPITKKKLKTLSFDIEDLTSAEAVMNKIVTEDHMSDAERNKLRSLVNNIEIVDTSTTIRTATSKLSIEALRESYASEMVAHKELLRENKTKYAKVMTQFSGSAKPMSEVPKPESLIKAEEMYVNMKKQIKLSMVHNQKLSVGAALNTTEREREIVRKRTLESASTLEKGIIAKAFKL